MPPPAMFPSVAGTRFAATMSATVTGAPSIIPSGMKNMFARHTSQLAPTPRRNTVSYGIETLACATLQAASRHSSDESTPGSTTRK